MSNIPLIVRSTTPFSENGDLDEVALRAHLGRLVDADFTIYMGSGGSGEGCALTLDELSRVYEIGVEVGKGRVQVGSNQPDQHTAAQSIRHAKLAMRAGVGIVSLYGPAAWHGYTATEAEYLDYFDRCLTAIDHPVAISPNPMVGFAPSPRLISQICDRHEQIQMVNLTGISGDAYFIQLKDVLQRDIPVTGEMAGAFNFLKLGGGLNIVGANFIPKTHRRFVDLFEATEYDEMFEVYRDIRQVTNLLSQWGKPTSPRLHKMVMRAFGLPGCAGGVREPYKMFEDAEVERFRTQALALNIPEINEMAQAADNQ